MTKSKGKKKGNPFAALAVAEAIKLEKRKTRKRNKKSNQKQNAMVMPNSRPETFGSVSSITTAPVAIGNSVRGASKQISRTAKGVTVTGRDFMFVPFGTPAAIQNWCLVGGTPLTPAAFADSVIANYQRMYMKFRFKHFVVHYITSSSTSSTGDIVFYYSKDRTSVFLNQTSTQFLPFVFTDQNTVMGPQWVNHSAKFMVTGDWKLTDYGMHCGVEEYADGEVFLLSKTTTTDSPGYVIFDYSIEFAEESFQPRLLAFPIPRIQWQPTCFGLTTVAVTTTTTPFYAAIGGKDITGAVATSNAFHSTVQAGDVYKVIFDVTNSLANSGNPAAWTNATTANLLEYDTYGVANAVTVGDGFTCYAVTDGTNFAFYVSAEAAFNASVGTNLGSQLGALRYGVTATITYTMCAWCSFVGALSSISNQPNF